MWSLCMIFEVVGIITFFLEIYQNVYICVSYMLKYQRFDFSCRITERIYSKSHFSSRNFSVYVEVRFIYPYVSISFYLLNIWLKASLIRGYVCECIYMYIIIWKWSYCPFYDVWQDIWKNREIQINLTNAKLTLKFLFCVRLKLFHVFWKRDPMIYTIGKILDLLWLLGRWPVNW